MLHEGLLLCFKMHSGSWPLASGWVKGPRLQPSVLDQSETQQIKLDVHSLLKLLVPIGPQPNSLILVRRYCHIHFNVNNCDQGGMQRNLLKVV